MDAFPPLSTAFPEQRILLISPHLDDAVFSASAVMQQLQVDVWTIFAGAPEAPMTTEWDRRCGYEDAQSLIEDRRKEDLEAQLGWPGEARHLDCLERAYTTPERRTADLQHLREQIDAWLAEGSGPSRVLLPVGAGVELGAAWWERLRARRRSTLPLPASDGDGEPGSSRAAPWWKRLAQDLLHRAYLVHRRHAQRRGMLANEDHLVVRDVLLDHLRGRDEVKVALYEELPYLWAERGDQQAARIAQASGLPARRIEARPDLADKHARIMRYVTQVKVMDPVHRRLESVETLPDVEVYWLLGT